MEKFKFDKKTIQEMGWKKWIVNFFFYYKWATLIILCSIAIVIGTIVTMVNEPNPDVSVYLICRSNTAAAMDLDKIQTKIANYSGDFDGKDGILARFSYSALPLVSPEILEVDDLESRITATDDENADVRLYLAAQATIVGEMESQTAIYVFDQTQYEDVMENSGDRFFLNLAERYPDLPIVDEYKLMVKDTIFAEDLYPAGDDLFFVVRAQQYMRHSDKEENIAYYEHQLAFFDAMVAAGK